MNNTKLEVINMFESILSHDIDLDSWAGLHFIVWCKERSYQNPSFNLFVEQYIHSENILQDIEKHSFKYRSFVEKYVRDEEKEPFFNHVLDAHHEHFKNQEVRGFEV